MPLPLEFPDSVAPPDAEPLPIPLQNPAAVEPSVHLAAATLSLPGAVAPASAAEPSYVETLPLAVSWGGASAAERASRQNAPDSQQAARYNEAK
jgi:hypothetical protein